MPYFIMAIRSTPMPKENPLIRELSYPGSPPIPPRRWFTDANTAGSTIPHPSNSIHPECLHFLHPFPPQKIQEICTSALGSVNGKKLGKNHVFTADPKSAFIAWSSVPFKSLKVIFVSTQSPSTW